MNTGAIGARVINDASDQLPPVCPLLESSQVTPERPVILPKIFRSYSTFTNTSS